MKVRLELTVEAKGMTRNAAAYKLEEAAKNIVRDLNEQDGNDNFEQIGDPKTVFPNAKGESKQGEFPIE